MNLFFMLISLSLPQSQADSWNGTNNPANMNANYNYVFDQLPLSGQVDPSHMPWSDNYWESDWGGIQLRWNTLTVAQRDPDLFDYRTVDRRALFAYTPPTLATLKTMTREQIQNLSPAEKYDIFMGRYDYPTVKDERSRTSPNMSDWQGLCHGWVPAAINEPEPAPIQVTNSDGIVIPFGSSDLKGILAYYYGVPAYWYARGIRKVSRLGDVFQFLDQVDSFDPYHWVSLAPNSVVYSNNRPISPSSLKDSAACVDPATYQPYGSQEKCIEAFSVKGTVDSLDGVSEVGSHSGSDPNAGAFFVVMTNQLALLHQSFAGNLDLYGHNQIWNQPITGYTSKIDYDHRGFRGGRVGITTTLQYVGEIPQTYTTVLGTPNERVKNMVFSYEVEIDGSGRVTGGTWTRGKHPGFIWAHQKLPIQGYFTGLKQILPH